MLREFGNALAARLSGMTPATVGYYGSVGRPILPTDPVDPPAKGPLDPRVQPYYVLYPGTGTDGPDPALCQTTPDGTTITVRITAAAGDVEDFLALVDRINGLLLGWTPVLTGHPFPGQVRRLPGYEAPMLNDASMSPPRQYALLQYQATV